MHDNPQYHQADYIWNVVTGAIGSSTIQVLAANPNRVCVVITVGLSGTLLYNFSTDKAPTTWASLQPNTAMTIINYSDIGPLVGMAWWLMNNSTGTSYTVYELLYVPDRNPEPVQVTS